MATQAPTFQPGETRTRNGWEYQRQPDGRWIPIRPATAPGAAPTPAGAAPATGPSIQIRPADPSLPTERETEQVRLDRERLGLQRDELNLQRDQAGRETRAEENRAAFLATRLAAAMREIQAQAQVNPDAAGPSLGAEAARTFGGDTAANYANEAERQAIEAAQFNAIDAALTLGTGAAYTREQIEGYRRSLFPALGDSPQAIASKRRQLEAMMAAARINAGAAAPQIDEALATLNTLYPATPNAPSDAPATGVDGVTGDYSDPNNPLRLGVGIDPNTGRPVSETPPPNRGDSQTAREAQMLENAILSGAPLVGPVIQGMQGMFGSETANAFGRGVADTTMLGFSDEVRAAVNAGVGQGGFNETLARERAIADYDTENNFGARLGGQVAGGFILPMSRAAALPRVIAEGAAYGGAYGLGSGEGSGRMTSALTGAALGGAAPLAFRAVGAGVRSAFGTRAGPTDDMRAVINAATEERVPISRPIADPGARTRMSRLEASVGGSAPVREGLEATERAIDDRVQQLVPGGTAAEPGAMGQRIQARARTWLGAEGRRIGRIYDRADAAAGDSTVVGTEAVRVLDDNIARLSQNRSTNAALIDYLRAVRADFVDDAGNPIPKTIGAIRDLRTGLSGEINRQRLGSTPAERIVSDALDAARTDITRDLGSTSPEALRIYNLADRQWRARAETRRQIIERVIGPADNPISGRQVMDRVRAMTKGDTPRLRRLWAGLDPQEQRDAAATIAATAGRKSPEEDFSPAQFIAWARTIEPSAREVVFGPEGARSIANLSRLSTELKNARGALNNTRSGMVANWAAFLRDFASGGVPGTLLGMVTGSGALATGAAGMAVGSAVSLGGVALRRLSARSLMSPDLTRWIARAPRATTPSAIRTHIGQLADIAARDPAIAQEATGLQQILLKAINDNAVPATGRAAASPDEGPAQE